MLKFTKRADFLLKKNLSEAGAAGVGAAVAAEFFKN